MLKSLLDTLQKTLPEASWRPLGWDLWKKCKILAPKLAPSWAQDGAREGQKRSKKATYVKIHLGTQLGLNLGWFSGRFWVDSGVVLG